MENEHIDMVKSDILDAIKSFGNINESEYIDQLDSDDLKTNLSQACGILKHIKQLLS